MVAQSALMDGGPRPRHARHVLRRGRGALTARDPRAKRELVGMLVAAVAEVGPGIRGGDAVEGGAERLVRGVPVPRRGAARPSPGPTPARSGSGAASRTAGSGTGSR